MRVKATPSKISLHGTRSTRGYRFDNRVERRLAHTYSRSRQWPVRAIRAMGPYRINDNKAKTTPGFPLGGKTAKTHTKASTGTIQPYTLGVVNIDEIAKGDGINERQRDIVHLKGWKVRVHVQNTYLVPITLQVALISPRQTLGGTSTARHIGLIRGYGNARSVNLGLGNTGLTQCINPINDDLYMVLFQSKLEIGPTAGATGYTGGVQENWDSLEKWTLLNKQLRYDATTAPSETPTFLVFWFDSKIRNGAQAFVDISATGACDVRTETISYFHDRD